MRKTVILASVVAAFGLMNYSIVRKEMLLRDGTRMFLRLAPRDPRSIMQGDYMELRYEIAQQVPEAAPRDGHIVVALDDRGIAAFIRIHAGEPLGSDERLLRYRRRRTSMRLGAESFFFQEGMAHIYESARYGELRVARSGDSVLVGLADEALGPLGPGLK